MNDMLSIATTDDNGERKDAPSTSPSTDHLQIPPAERIPRIQISVSFTSDVCHKSGSPPFSIQLSFHKYEDCPVTLHRGDWIFKLPTALQTPGVSFKDAQDGKIIKPMSLHMCHVFGKGSKPEPRPEYFISILAHQTYTYGAVVNEVPTIPMLDDYLQGLELGKRFEVAIEPEIALRWWAWGTKEQVLSYLRKDDASRTSDGTFDLHETPLVLEFTHAVSPTFTVQS